MVFHLVNQSTTVGIYVYASIHIPPQPSIQPAHLSSSVNCCAWTVKSLLQHVMVYKNFFNLFFFNFLHSLYYIVFIPQSINVFNILGSFSKVINKSLRLHFYFFTIYIKRAPSYIHMYVHTCIINETGQQVDAIS